MALSLENRHVLSVGSFLHRFPVSFNLCLVTPCLVVAVQLCMHGMDFNFFKKNTV